MYFSPAIWDGGANLFAALTHYATLASESKTVSPLRVIDNDEVSI